MDPKLPLESADIQAILPHRFPFVFVDRIVELHENQRIVGIKVVSNSDPYLSADGAQQGLPPTVIIEALAQVGAVLLLSRPENRGHVPLFVGIKRLRIRRPAPPGSVLTLEVSLVRARSRAGMFKGVARIGTEVVMTGTMAFAVAPHTSTS